MDKLASIIQTANALGRPETRQAFRGRFTGTDTKRPIQRAQVKTLEGELLSDLGLYQQFGLTSAPPVGTEAIVLPLSGRTRHSLVIATEHGEFRVAVGPGETCLYNQSGAKITLKQGRRIEIECDDLVINAANSITCKAATIEQAASGSAAYSAPALSFGGADGGAAAATLRADINQEGSITSTGDHTVSGTSFLSHVHGGVLPGGGQTGAPV